MICPHVNISGCQPASPWARAWTSNLQLTHHFFLGSLSCASHQYIELFFFSKLWLCCLQLDEMLLGLFEHLSKTHQLLCFNATAYRNSLPKNESKFKNFLVCGTQQEIFWRMYWLFSRVSELNLRNGSVWVNWVKCLTEKYDSRIIWFEFATSVNSHECVKSVKCENEKLFQC